jgi:prepilin-type N-terminal cleavage/methylation domain-containing protein
MTPPHNAPVTRQMQTTRSAWFFYAFQTYLTSALFMLMYFLDQSNPTPYRSSMKTKQSSKTKAVTLIELLVVIVIIAVILAMTLPFLAAAKKRADEQRAAEYKREADQTAARHNAIEVAQKKHLQIQETASALQEPFQNPLDLTGTRGRFTTALAKNSQVINLGHGLYFFNKEESDALETVASFGRENTNLEMVVTFSAKNTAGVNTKWYAGYNVQFDLSQIPNDLFITNGVFVVFKDREQVQVQQEPPAP